MAKAFYSTPELAEMLGVFHSTVRRWIERDQVKGFRVGRNYKIPATEVKRMLDRHGLPLPETMDSHPLNPENKEAAFFPPGKGSKSILQSLLIVDDVKDPALVFRRDMILGANKRFADLVGHSQIDLIGIPLDRVVDGFNGGIAKRWHTLQNDKPYSGPWVYPVCVKTGSYKKRELIATVDGLDGLQDVLLLVVKDEK